MHDDISHPDVTAELIWQCGRPVPIDYAGPTDVCFEPFLPQWIEQPAILRFIAMLHRFRDKVAIDDGATRLTYGAVGDAVAELAGRIVAATDEAGPIAAVLDNTAVFPVVFLACLMTGRPIIPIDVSYPAERQAAILRDCGAVAVVVGAGVALPADLGMLPRLDAPEVAAVGAVAPPISRGVDLPAGVVYTSGSTGAPKGVAFSQRQFMAALADYVNACHIGPDDRLCGLASLGGASVREALAALLTGGTIHIADLRRVGLGAALRALADARVSVLAFVPSVLRGIVALPGAAAALASLRVLDLFGEVVTAETVAALRAVLPRTCHIRVSLGSTETMNLFHWFVPPDFVADGPALPCGYLADRKAIALLDEAGAPVAPGAVGELVVRSRCIASGMWRAGAVLAGPFRPDPDDPESRILATGDLIRLRADGLAEFVGRRDRRVKIHGLRADAGDVEAALHRVAGIADCAVVTRASAGDMAFVAYVVPGGSAPLSPGAIRAALAGELPSHMVPAEIHLLDSLPRLSSFKPDLVALARRDAS
jgi:acyl-coenzyme A synthetase/AMP-(fatty) acid ligase